MGDQVETEAVAIGGGEMERLVSTARLNDDGSRDETAAVGSNGDHHLDNQAGILCETEDDCDEMLGDDGFDFGNEIEGFDDGYDVFQEEIESARQQHEKERNGLVQQLKREREAVKTLTDENERLNNALIEVKEHCERETEDKLKLLRMTLQENADSAVKEVVGKYDAKLQALNGKVDDLRVELMTTKEAARSDLEENVRVLTNDHKQKLAEAVCKREQKLQTEHEGLIRDLKSKYQRLEESSKEDLKRMKESRDELQGVLLRGIEASPNDTLIQAAESFAEDKKNAKRDWQIKEEKLEETVRNLEKEVRQTRKGQHEEVKAKYEGKIAVLQQEKESLETEIKEIERGQQKERENAAVKRRELLQKLIRSNNAIKDLRGKLEAKDAVCRQLEEKIRELKVEFSRAKGEAERREQATYREHETQTNYLKREISNLREALKAKESENTDLNRQIVDKISQAKDEIIKLKSEYEREKSNAVAMCKKEEEASKNTFFQTLTKRHVQTEKELREELKREQEKVDRLKAELGEKENKINELDIHFRP
ncbi:early endosome antigen 1-like [Lineus longissimus]|uniref:early endosome antigen 1-like n=1 Tax=Lineus longissimus TaxID=88925 RepID=UPI00315C814A